MPGTEQRFVEDAFDLIDALEDRQALAPAAIRGLLSPLLARCGYDRFIVTRLPLTAGRLGPEMIVRQWPDAWLTHYDRSGYYASDPVARHCFSTLEPFDWAQARWDPVGERAAGRVMGEAAEHGLAHGMCVPIHDITGFLAVVSMAGERVDLSPKMRKALHLVGIAAYGAAVRSERRPRRPQQPRSLSEREKEVLTLLGAGQTAAATAHRLGLSRATVITHIRNARAKLSAENALHAVVQAYRYRELRF